jgi:hypothetical protein
MKSSSSKVAATPNRMAVSDFDFMETPLLFILTILVTVDLT